MSKPRYDWWSYVKAIIRRYPSLKYADVSGISLCEKEAVEAAIATTERMQNGMDRLAVVDMVFWKQTHTLSGAAMMIPCGYETAKRWQQQFIKQVARSFKCDGLLQKE